MVEQTLRNVKQSYFDIIADDVADCYKFDINSKGWGVELSKLTKL
jgi:hypothetical protein